MTSSGVDIGYCCLLLSVRLIGS